MAAGQVGGARLQTVGVETARGRLAGHQAAAPLDDSLEGGCLEVLQRQVGHRRNERRSVVDQDRVGLSRRRRTDQGHAHHHHRDGNLATATSRRGYAAVSVHPPTVGTCASSTPPTGIWAGPSTARGCSRTRRPTSTTCSRSSTPSGSTWCVVAGDIYDRALPPVDAVRLADETLVRLARSRARVVLTSGNHDSAQRLGLQRSTHRRGRRAHPGRRVVGRHARAARRRARPGRRLRHPLPRPARCRRALGAVRAPPRGRAHRGDGPGPRRPRAAAAGTRSVVLAHAFVAGARPLRLRARHQRRRRLASCRPRSSTASTTPRSAICTASTP